MLDSARIVFLLAAAASSLLFAAAAQAQSARAVVDPERVIGQINPHIYGQFLEHIYHSVEDGLYGELVRDRAFPAMAGLSVKDGTITLDEPATDVKRVFGDPTWTDYDFTLRARKLDGGEGFLILVRARDEKNFYWWNLGGWGNTAHQMEVEENDLRRPIGPHTPGKIEANRWYSLRVRVEGDHIQGWIDGEQALDFRDATHGSGGVGVGFWATRGEYTDLKVTDLNGRDLSLSLAREAPGMELSDQWAAYPAGSKRAEMVRYVPSPNTGFAVRLTPSGEAAGIAQKRHSAVAGKSYPGSVWSAARGGVAPGWVAMLAADGSELARARLPKPTAELKEYRFTLRPKRTDPQATLVVAYEGQGEVWVDMVSMTRSDYVRTGCRTDLLAAVKGLQAPIIRWPGGCFASIYRWKKAVGPQHERKPFRNYVWGEWDSNGFGVSEYIRLCRTVGCEPLIVVNLGSWADPSKEDEYVREALEWVEYCNGGPDTPMGRLRASHGDVEPYNVTHWELDNETWGMGVERYGKVADRVAQAMKQRWPGLKLYACTFYEKEDARLLELCGRHIDFISYHFYEDPNNYATAPANFEAIWKRYEKLIAASPNPNVKLAVTEWNAQSTDWRTGLFAAGYLNVMERSCGVVQMATPALFLRRTDAKDWDNAFINLDHLGWFPAPNYVVMKLYRDHFQPNLVSCENPGPLNIAATRSEDGKKLVLKIVNAAKEAVRGEVEVAGGLRGRRAQAWQALGGLSDRNTMQEPGKIAARPIKAPVAGGIVSGEFPPLSVTLIEFSSQ